MTEGRDRFLEEIPFTISNVRRPNRMHGRYPVGRLLSKDEGLQVLPERAGWSGKDADHIARPITRQDGADRPFFCAINVF